MVFAVFGVIGVIASVALFMVAGNTSNPVVKIMQDNPSFALWMKLSIPLGLLTCAALLAAGIGLMMLKPWARLVSIGYAIYAIVFGIVGMVINFFFLVRPMIEHAQQQSGPEAAVAIGGAVGGTIGGCFGLIYPIVLLIFMFRANVVAAFKPQTPLE